MKKSVFKIKCPQHIVWGDPMYFEEYSGKKLHSLVVDYNPLKHYEARVVLTEEDLGGIVACSMIIYCAPPRELDMYLNGKKLSIQQHETKEIGVDTARYLIKVDAQEEEIRTGADGYYGYSIEFSHTIVGQKKISDGVLINIDFPKDITFDEIQSIAKFLFGDLQPMDKNQTKDHKKDDDAR